MNKKLSLILTIMIIVFIIIGGSMYFTNANKNNNSAEEKVKDELNYIGKEIINMMNQLNNISFTDTALKETTEINSKSNNEQSSESRTSSGDNENTENNKKYSTEMQGVLSTNLSNIDWEYLKNNVEKLYDIWTTTIIDLHSLNVNNDDILNFSSTLDQVTLSIKSEDKISSINNLASLYSYIPLYFDQISNDKKILNINNTRACLLNSYVFIEKNDWDETKTQIQYAINYFTDVLNNVDENSKYSKSKITRIYVLLNELNNAINLQDKEIYYIKYKNVIDELINL